MKRKYWSSLAWLLVLGMVLAACGDDEVADYPEDREITLVIPFGLGSGDAQARNFAQIAAQEEHLGQSIIPTNHPGANSEIGVRYAMDRPADGYTLLFHSGSYVLAVASEQIDFDIDSVRPVVSFNADYLVTAVRDDSPFESMEDVAAYAAENPGELNVGGTVLGGTHHIFAELVMAGLDIDANYIPYEGAQETLSALLGGDIDLMATSPSTTRDYEDAGDVRILGQSTRERTEFHPDVPTFYEMGVTELDDFINYRVIYVHPDTPDEIVDQLEEAFTSAFESDEWQQYLEDEQMMPFYRDAAGLQEHIDNYYESILNTLEATGLR